MKKAYINPETCIVLVGMQTMMAGSNPDGFNGTPKDDTTITPEEMLTRRRKSVWDDGMEEEEEMY